MICTSQNVNHFIFLGKHHDIAGILAPLRNYFSDISYAMGLNTYKANLTKTTNNSIVKAFACNTNLDRFETMSAIHNGNKS